MTSRVLRRWSWLLMLVACHRGPPAPAPDMPTAAMLADGPPGLKWGMSPDQVRPVLNAQYLPTGEETLTQEHSTALSWGPGEFQHHDTDMELAYFCNRTDPPRLVQFAVVMRHTDRPLYERWHELVDHVTANYGPPSKSVEPPATVLPGDLPTMPLSNGEDQLSGKYDLRDAWSLPRGRALIVEASVADAARRGQKTVDLKLIFLDTFAAAACNRDLLQKPNSSGAAGGNLVP